MAIIKIKKLALHILWFGLVWLWGGDYLLHNTKKWQCKQFVPLVFVVRVSRGFKLTVGLDWEIKN